MSGDVYEGNFKDGIYHGKGIYIFKNGDKHEGEWIYGKRNGKFKDYTECPILNSIINLHVTLNIKR